MEGYNPFSPFNDDIYLDFKDKEDTARQLSRYMFNRTNKMFEWRNLPETIPARNLELLLQMNGFAIIARADDGNLYAFYGGLGGEPNPYYEPTLATVANPALNFNKVLKIGEDCVVIRNDSTYFGLRPMFSRYASLQAENAISLRLADINTRIKQILSACDDETKASAELFLKRIEGGDLGVIADQALLESLSVNQNANLHSEITDLIEYEQYIKASWFNEIGLNANYNMKRESLNSSESQMNDDALLPLPDDMQYNRKEGALQMNEMFGTDVEVALGGVWKKEQYIQLTEEPGITEETAEDPEEEQEEYKEEDTLNLDDNDTEDEEEPKEEEKEEKEDA